MSTNLLIIEDQTIKAMLGDPRIVALLPCLNDAQQKINELNPGGRHCNTCKKDKQNLVVSAFDAAKSCILNTRGQKLTELKNLLGTRQLRIYTNSGSKRNKYTL